MLKMLGSMTLCDSLAACHLLVNSFKYPLYHALAQDSLILGHDLQKYYQLIRLYYYTCIQSCFNGGAKQLRSHRPVGER